MNTHAEGELDQELTTEELSVVRKEGKRNAKHLLLHYKFDVVISVGYCLNRNQQNSANG